MSGLSFSGIGTWLIDHWGLLYKAVVKLLVGKVILDLEKQISEKNELIERKDEVIKTRDETINTLNRPANIIVGGNYNVVAINSFNEDEKLYRSDVSLGANTVVVTASVPMDIETSATLDGGLKGSISGEASLGPLPSDDPETEEDT